jgi:thymidylate kinase
VATSPRAINAPLDAHALELVGALCDGLEARGIRYCHWKSNEAITRSASGDNDLDLLVERDDAAKFFAWLRELGFKTAVAPTPRQRAGVVHMYGLDEPTGRIVHLDVSFQLIVGDDMTKNHRLPIERPYLASATRRGLFRQPALEMELVVFVVRMVLKHATWDAIAMRRGSLTRSERAEWAQLMGDSQPARTRSLALTLLPSLTPRIWNACVEAVRPDAGIITKWRAARGLLRALSVHAQRPRAVDAVLRIWRRSVVAFRRLMLHRPGAKPKRLDDGGAVMAIVGGDGAGKSSAVIGVEAWLRPAFWTTRMHMGKPTPSILSLVTRAAIAGGRRVVDRSARPIASQGDLSKHRGGTAWLVGCVMIARDRRRAYRRARRLAARGALVVCDRFPLARIRQMDGPRAAHLRADPTLTARQRRLVELEQRIYDQIAPPDMLFVLRVSPDVAVARKVEEDGAYVRRRSAEIWQIDWAGADAAVIDASRTKEQVLASLRAEIWARL